MKSIGAYSYVVLRVPTTMKLLVQAWTSHDVEYINLKLWTDNDFLF